MLTPESRSVTAPSNKPECVGTRGGAAVPGVWERPPALGEVTAVPTPGLLAGTTALAAARRMEHLPEGAPAFRILVVDDDASLRKACCEIASGMGFVALAAGSVQEALALLLRQPAEMLLLDLKLPGGGGPKLLGEVKTLYPRTGVVVMTAFATAASAMEAMRIGAIDYLTKPFALEELTDVLGRSSRRLHYDLESRRLQRTTACADRSGRPDWQLAGDGEGVPHPLQGGALDPSRADSGRERHGQGDGGAGDPRQWTECGETIHRGRLRVAGADPDRERTLRPCEGRVYRAHSAKGGLLSASNGGTVFLDEIGNMTMELQAKLLRALQEKEVRPVGAIHTVPISARVLASTNRDLKAMMAQRLFRNDLYYRLSVVNLKLPPLRERRRTLRCGGTLPGRDPTRDGLVACLQRGGDAAADRVRLAGQCARVGECDRARLLAVFGACAARVDLPTQLQEFQMQRLGANAPAGVAGDGRVGGNAGESDAVVSIADMEKQAILGTIRQLNGDKLMAAKLLGIGKTTLYRKLKEYGLTGAVELTGD